MGVCTVCNEETKYCCINCEVFICNRSLDCHVAVEEDSFTGWEAGRKVAICHPCKRKQSSESSKCLKQFEMPCASRGYHVYREIWKPALGEHLQMSQELGNVHDPFAIAIKVKIRGRLTNDEIAGHIPREISRFCHYFLNYGGTLEGRVQNAKYRPSPIPSGGLEIPIILIVKRQNTDSAVFKKMKDLLEEYYIEPNKINSVPDSHGNDDDFQPFEPFELERPQGEHNEISEIECVCDEQDEIIVIDDSELED